MFVKYKGKFYQLIQNCIKNKIKIYFSKLAQNKKIAMKAIGRGKFFSMHLLIFSELENCEIFYDYFYQIKVLRI